MGLLDDLSIGTQVADTVTKIVEGVGATLQQLGVVALNDQQKAEVFKAVNEVVEGYNTQVISAYKVEIDDLKSARDTQVNILKDAPHWVKALAAVVIPYGGLLALSVFFFNIMAPWIAGITHCDIPRVALTDHEAYTIDGIIVFFFGYRLTQKLTGIAGKY